MGFTGVTCAPVGRSWHRGGVGQSDRVPQTGTPWPSLRAGLCTGLRSGSAYGFMQGAWPFGLVEAVWSLVALNRWWRGGGVSPLAVCGWGAAWLYGIDGSKPWDSIPFPPPWVTERDKPTYSVTRVIV